MRGSLKRKFTEADENTCYTSSSLSSPASSEWESDGESSSSDNQDFTPHSPSSPTSLPIASIVKRPKPARRQNVVRFDRVTVFSFPRCQGFTSVPSHGGSTLGMVRRHSYLQKYTVAEHTVEQRHKRRQRLKDRLREERVEALKHKFITRGAVKQREKGRLTLDQVPNEDNDVHIGDAELEDGCVLQRYSPRQRQALLLAAGVQRIDNEERKQLHILRLSRESCGCDCQGFCEPETCACSLAGIKCQVDRFNFPCRCTKDGCGNTEGHVEFDSRRVQTHYIHTVMRLQLERQLRDETLNREDQTRLPEDLVEFEDQGETLAVKSAQDKSCPFGFSLGEDDLPLTMPSSLSFGLIQERSAVEDTSCNSNMTESSCSSSDYDGGCQNMSEVNGELSRALTICCSEKNSYSLCSQLRHMREPHTQHSSRSSTYSTIPDRMEPLRANTFTDNISRTSVTNYLHVIAKQSRDFFDGDSLEGFPGTPSLTLDYSSSRYMDPSLSSDSDFEFFDSDYPSGPLHSSFKGHRHPDVFHHVQLFSSVHLPQCESSTYLLESLIGLTEPSHEQVYENRLS